MGEEQLKLYFQIYTDCWKLFKDHSNPSADKEFWEKLSKNGEEIYNKYPGSSLAKSVVIATMEEINEVYQSKNKK